MSYTSEIKQEIAYNDLKDCCEKAQLSALVQLTSSIEISNGKVNLAIKSESPTTAKRAMQLLKKRYDHIKSDLEVIQKTNLRKNNIYRLTIYEKANDILFDLGLYNTKGLLLEHPLYNIIAKDCCARAYLAGSFLAFGSCNNPSKTSYHLEISLMSINHAEFMVKLLKRFNIEAKITKRRNKYVVYLKKADDISDFLRCVGAHESLMKFENTRIARDFKNSFIRTSNCDIANEVKTLNAANKQIEDMELIIANHKYDGLNDKLKMVIDLRLKHREANLNELAKIYYDHTGERISKSGLQHRLVKIKNIAKELRHD